MAGSRVSLSPPGEGWGEGGSARVFHTRATISRSAGPHLASRGHRREALSPPPREMGATCRSITGVRYFWLKSSTGSNFAVGFFKHSTARPINVRLGTS